MKLCIKRFYELSVEELYAILKLRVNVFVVEQDCPYPELDDRDQEAVHVWLEDMNGIHAYLRIMDRGVESEHVSIGRVIAAKRHQGLGTRILSEGVRIAKDMFQADAVCLEAQVYAIPFYQSLGFEVVSEEFLEDGVPHVKMIRKEA
jgi:ElaA protein